MFHDDVRDSAGGHEVMTLNSGRCWAARQAPISAQADLRGLLPWVERRSDLAPCRARSKQPLDEKVDRDPRITGLHLRNPGLAGAHPRGQCSLSQLLACAGLPELEAESNPHLDQLPLDIRELKEVRRVADAPPSSSEPLLPILFHQLSPFRAA